MPNFKNLQFILSYIDQNPGCSVIEVRTKLAERNGKLHNLALPYAWYFSRRRNHFERKMGYDYGYWVNLNKGPGRANLSLTRKGKMRLNDFKNA